MKLLSLIFLLAFLISCRKVEQAQESPVELGISSFIKEEFPYVGDESLNFFLKNPWYTYDENNHIIWPNFQVYVLKAKGKYYKLQVADYYDDSSAPGNYTIRVEEQNETAFDWSFNAQGCGNVYTNLTYKECLKDPSRNVYTYLDVGQRRSWQMSEQEALLNKQWDIAFNGTEVKINSGSNGVGDARIGDLYIYSAFFNGTVADFQRIAEVSFSDQGQRFFNIDLDLQGTPLSLPPGIDRIIYEGDWLNASNPISFFAKSDRWWMLWGGEKESFFKFRVKKISDETFESSIRSQLTFEFFQQLKGQDQFEENALVWNLPVFDSSKRLIRWCLDFDSRSVISCSDKRWDLRLSISNRGKKRRWRLNVNTGAIGPLTEQDMKWRRSGLPPFL